MLVVINLISQLVYAPDFTEIIVPMEQDNNCSQIPMAKFISTAKQSEYLYTLYMQCKNCRNLHSVRN